MKTSLRSLLGPVIFIFAAVGAAYYVGWSQGGKLSDAESQLLAPVPSPTHGTTGSFSSQRAKTPPRTFLSSADAQAQIADILAGNLPEGARNAQDAIANILSQMNPADATVLAASLPAGSMRNALLRQEVLSWARGASTKAALDWINALAPDEAQSLLATILTRPTFLNALGPDPVVEAQYLDKLTDPTAHDQAIGAISSGMAHKDPAGALDWLNHVATGDAYAKAVAAVFNVLVAPTQESTQTPGGGMRTSFTFGLQDPTRAVNLLSQVTDPAARAGAIDQIANGWAKMDPAAAVSWAASLPDADSAARASALNSIVTSWSKDDPEAAAALVQKSGDPTLFQASAPTIADSLAKENPQMALQFVQSLPDGATKDQAFNNILVNIAPQNFSMAWNMATSLPEDASRNAAMASLISAQANIDPAQAVDLIHQFPTAIAEQNATHVLAKTWLAQDPQAATAWMQTLPPDGDGIRNAAIGELITAQVNKDPATTLQWANLITTDETRTNAIQRVVTTWAKTDPTAALNALQSAKITDEKRAAIAQIINQGLARAK